MLTTRRSEDAPRPGWLPALGRYCVVFLRLDVLDVPGGVRHRPRNKLMISDRAKLTLLVLFALVAIGFGLSPLVMAP